MTGMLKHCAPLLSMLLITAACKPSTTAPPVAEVKERPTPAGTTSYVGEVWDDFRCDSVKASAENQYGKCEIYIDYPMSGSPSLMNATREWIASLLFDDALPDTSTPPDSLARRYCREALKGFEESLQQMAITGYSSDEAPEQGLEIRIAYQDERIVTLEASHFSYFTGGGHGTFGTRGATFRKRDGYDYGDHLLTHTDERLHQLMTEGLVRYFEVADSSALKSILTMPLSQLPMPTYPPYIVKNGVRFQYDLYDICSFDYGDPWFTIPKEQMLPYLNEDLR